MQKLLTDIVSILKAIADWAIIWFVGPDGVIFDIQNILKIIISGAIALWLLIKFLWNLSQKL